MDTPLTGRLAVSAGLGVPGAAFVAASWFFGLLGRPVAAIEGRLWSLSPRSRASGLLPLAVKVSAARPRRKNTFGIFGYTETA